MTSWGIAFRAAQDIEALPSARRFDPTPCETPQVTQKRAEDNMSRIDKKDGAFTGVRFR
jgi:hypothetical protein